MPRAMPVHNAYSKLLPPGALEARDSVTKSSHPPHPRRARPHPQVHVLRALLAQSTMRKSGDAGRRAGAPFSSASFSCGSGSAGGLGALGDCCDAAAEQEVGHVPCVGLPYVCNMMVPWCLGPSILLTRAVLACGFESFLGVPPNPVHRSDTNAATSIAACDATPLLATIRPAVRKHRKAAAAQRLQNRTHPAL